MRSSISSSEEARNGTPMHRAPRIEWGRTWTAVLILVLLVLGCWEVAWRLHGLQPIVQDDDKTWAIARARAAGPDTIILIGSSRMHSDVDLDEFKRLVGRAPVQLSLANTHPLPVLEDLARDPDVTGTILCGVSPHLFFDGDRLAGPGVMDYVLAYQEGLVSPFTRAERRIALFLEASLVSITAVKPVRVWNLLQAGRWPRQDQSHVWTFRTDRQRLLTFDDPVMRAQRTERVADFRDVRPLRHDELDVLLVPLRRSVARISARGGRVVFVRLPSHGLVRLQEMEMFPREQYWRRLEKLEGASSVHFEDHPRLSGYITAEGSHLDYRAAPAFTRDLVGVLALTEQFWTPPR